MQNLYSDAAVELKRLESNSYSPIFSHFGETISGLVTVRAFRKGEEFSARNIFLLNVSNRAMWPLMVANRWLSSRLQGINVIFAYIISLLVGEWVIRLAAERRCSDANYRSRLVLPSPPLVLSPTLPIAARSFFFFSRGRRWRCYR